mmetsp:Transcript_49461/g.159698  ORF Transcript_49461/g.159698 Transcript_49461/m.159698 type:complete len:963 (-) Transcript_49461:142-3030(-)
MRLVLSISLLALLVAPSASFLLGIDFGSQFFKAAVVAPGKPFEIVHNQHSKRKTPTAVSFNEQVRTFGDDAIVSATRGIPKSPMLFPLQLGRNFTGVSTEDLSFVPKMFYPYALGVNESGSLRFDMGEESYTVEEITGHILNFAKALAQLAAESSSVTETVLTVNSEATFVQRRALLAAAKIAGLPRTHLVHETSAAALQRALDLDLSGANGTKNESTVLFYNMGARHSEACVMHFRGATHMSKPTVSMNVLGCGTSEEVGGHLVDMKIAQTMLKAFQDKKPKLAEGVVKNIKALKKLEKEAMGLKHVLSANKEGLFRVESLFEDTDFSQPVKREDLEGWCSSVFDAVSTPITKALEAANITVADLDEVEMIGGGWRIPKIQALISEHLQANRPADLPALNLSQHINGDEAMATGAAFYGANSSVSFRTKRIFFTDASPHAYTLQLSVLNASQPHEEGWGKNVELFPAGSKLGSKKTVKLHVAFDVRASLFENGNPIIHWELSGLHEAASGKYVNLSTPLLSLKLELDSSGVVQVSSATAVFDEPVVVEEAAPKVDTNTTENDTKGSEEAGSENSTADSNAEKDAAEKEAESAESGEGGEAAEVSDAGEALADAAANTTDGKRTKTKIMKRKVSMEVAETFEGVMPRPLTVDELQQAIERLKVFDAADKEMQKIGAAKNALEAYIYESRDKIGDDENCQKVSTEEDRGKVSEALSTMEDWLYEDEARDANVTLLTEKLESLQALVVPIRSRAWEVEQRETLPELVVKVKDYVNSTLSYVEKNMTWVDAKEREGVANLTAKFEEWYANLTEQQETKALTEEPAYTAQQVKMALSRMQSEATRLTKIRKIDPMPYSNDYGKGGYGGKDDPRMKKYYEEMMKNRSRNGTNGSDWFSNFSNFSGFKGWNDSEYMRSYYEHAANNFSDGGDNDSSTGAGAEPEPESAGADGAGAGAGEGEDAGKTEL